MSVDREQYIRLFQRLIDSMTNIGKFDRPGFIDILTEICYLFNLSKGVTEFYLNLSAEKAGQGEVMVDYDDGRPGRIELYKRFVTPSMTVIKSTIYMPEDAEPLSEEDHYKLDLIVRATLSFISRNRLQGFVEKLAFYDGEGYPNINYFTRYLEKVNEKSVFSGKTAIQFNLRHFALINQEIGRELGDVVMRNYFEEMKKLIGDDGVICRMGGDNFLVLLRNDVLQQALFMLEGFPVTYDKEREKRIMVSAYAGVYVIPDDFVFDHPGSIFGKVIPAGQEAKFCPESNIVYYTEKTNQRKEQNMRVRRLFAEGMDKDEFRAYYQPKVDVVTGRIVGAEALCRWLRDGKIVPPMEFIPILEQNTDICRLDFRMLDIVCRDIRRWLDEGRKVVRVSVNLSRKHLLDVDLLEHLMKIIDENKVPHEYIELELTETTTDVEFRDLKRVVGGLRKAGIFTTVDDFGIGYSSLNLIREIPWDVLKLDRCFMPAEDSTDDSNVTELMFSHVVSMARSMGLECVAEGVETKKQLELLKANNCLIAQGFLFDRPLPVNEFEQRLEKRSYDVEL